MKTTDYIAQFPK